MRNDKKGQVTLFVILGLVVFLMVFITVYLNVQDEQELVDEELVVIDDARLRPVVEQVEYCLGFLAREALEDLGVRGGFLDVNPDAYIFGSEPGYINNALELFPGSGLVLPYWYGIQDGPGCVNCDFYINRPVLDAPVSSSIRGQVENYVEDNLVSCVNFDIFEDTLEINFGEPFVVLSFEDGLTIPGVEWSLNVSPRGEDVFYGLEYFEYELDIAMKEIYEIASFLLNNLIIVDGLLDDFAIDVSDYMASQGRSGDVPPRSGGVEYEFGAPTIWLRSDVERIMSQALAENIHYIQIIGSRDHFIAHNTGNFFLDSFIGGLARSIPSNSELVNTRITFNYLDRWPLFLRVNPSSGEVIMPASHSVPMISFLPMTLMDYDFSYDLSFPVLVTLENNAAFGGEGYLFQFVAESNIRFSSRYSDNITIESIDDGGFGYGDPLYMDIPVTVEVFDALTGLPLEGITVGYDCAGDVVVMGESEMRDGSALVEYELGTCLIGNFDIFELDFYAESYFESILEGEEYYIELAVYPLQDVEVSVAKKLLLKERVSGVDTFTLGASTILPELEEEIILVLMNNENPDFLRTLHFNYENEYTDEIDLLPGSYDIMLLSNLFREENFTTLEEEVCWDNQPWWPFGGEECETIDGVDLGNITIVGYLDLSGDYAVEINQGNISTGHLTFVYPGIDYGQIVHTRDLDLLGKLFEVNTLFDLKEEPDLLGLETN